MWPRPQTKVTVFIYRADYETDLFTFWTNNGDPCFPRERLLVCEVNGSEEVQLFVAAVLLVEAFINKVVVVSS